jgi:hypothetical protein
VELTRRGSDLVRWWRVFLQSTSDGGWVFERLSISSSVRPLFEDREYMSLLTITGFAESWHLVFFKQLEQNTARILKLINAELGE